MFVEKTKAELEGMSADALQSYYSEKLAHEKTEFETRIKAVEAKLEKGETDALKAELDSLLVASKEQGAILSRLKENASSAFQIRAIEGSIDHALKANAENFKKAKEGRHDFNFELALKAVGDMTFGANLSGGNMPQAQRLEGINDIVEREAIVYGAIPKMVTSGNTIDWVYETAQEGSASGTAEGASKNQIDNNFVVTAVSLLKQTAYFKVSTEMLDDVSFMGTWLRNKLITRLFLRIDSQVLIGGGTGTNLNGVYTQATAFSAGSFALSVDNANEVDVLVVADNQIKLANHRGQRTIVMHPSDVTKLKLIKMSATDKRYVDRLMMVGSTLTMDGIPIKETTAIDAGKYLIGDLSKALIAEKGSISIDVGLDGNDFTENMRTILGEWRGEVIIENNFKTAFVKGVFATDMAALETA